MPRQKQLSIALQRIDSKKPRLLQLSTDLSSSGLPGVQFHSVLLLLCIHVQIFDVHTNSNSCLYNMRTHRLITHFSPTMTSVVMVLNLFLYLLQICILQVPRRQPRPGDSVMGRRVAFQCDVNVLMMVLHESNPVFPQSYQDTSWL